MHLLVLAICCLVSGHIHTQSGVPLAHAEITLRGVSTMRTSSDAHGTFSVQVAPGQYAVDATLRGYEPAHVVVDVDRDVNVDVALEAINAPTLRVISTVYVNGRLAASHGTVPSIAVTREDFERMGYDRVIDGLAEVPSLTFARPHGGASTGPAVVALRGPDPSETLITLDGQLLNDANTGDLDLSLFPVAAFSAVDVTEGLGPQDSEGSNTIGGGVNLVSLRPAKKAHSIYSLSAGSFGRTEGWYNTTGTQGRLGYAFGLDDQQEAGLVDQTATVHLTGGGTQNTHLGSSISARSAMGNLVWTFSPQAEISARVFSLGNVRDESGAINGIDATAGSPTYGTFIGPGNQTWSQDVRAYQVRARAPLGAGELTAEASANDNNIDVVGSASDPMYDVVHQDKRWSESLAWGRTFDRSEYRVGGMMRYEYFTFMDPSGAFPKLGQTIDSYFINGGWQSSPKLHLNAGLYASHYTTFGSNLDWRAGAVYNAGPKDALRFSVGTGFRAPLLIERYLFPVAQLQQDANGVFVGQGNATEMPEHATEYELGFSHEFTSAARLDVSLYRTNLRDPIENFYPLALAGTAPGQCGDPAFNSAAAPNPKCFSYPINVGNVVYQGAEMRFVQRFAPQHLFVTAMYGLNVAYPTNFGATIANPTSGGNLVNGQQFLGIPQQQGSLGLDWSNNDWHAAIDATFRGNNNELNRPPFTLIDAGVGKRFANGRLDVTLAGTNILNDGAGRYTLFGAGVPYNGNGGPIPTDRYSVEPAGVRLIVTVRQ